MIGAPEQELVSEVLASGMLSLGPMLGRFEQAFADKLGIEAADVLAMSSGTTALHLAVRRLGWGGGDRVLTSPLTFVASSNCLLYEDAEPLFCDVDPVTLCIDPDAAADAADSEGVAGILPIHIFGHPAAMTELEQLASRLGIPVLEDAAQALGAICSDGRPAGGRGNPAAFAFYANKQITTGEGGLLVMPDETAAEIARSERNQGRAGAMKVMDHERLGFNYRLTDIQCAIGIAQLDRFADLQTDRARIAAHYDELLGEIGGAPAGEGPIEDLVLPSRDQGQERRSWFVYTVRLPRGVDRDGVIEALDREGIDARGYIPCVHLQSVYRERFGFEPGTFPVAEDYSARALALPFFPGLEPEKIERVGAAVRSALGR